MHRWSKVLLFACAPPAYGRVKVARGDHGAGACRLADEVAQRQEEVGALLFGTPPACRSDAFVERVCANNCKDTTQNV